MASPRFDGFPAAGLRFLAELAKNNRRDWFEAHRDRYEREVRGPALAFIEAVAPGLGRVAPSLVASAKKVGGSLMRIHRDVRFGKDKSPYKTNIGVHFRHQVGKDVHAPGVYVHVAPDGCFFGAGVWRPDPAALARIRTAIVERDDDWQRIVRAKKFRDRFELEGESLQRTPRGFEPDHPLADDLRRKDHIAMAPLTAEVVTSPDLLPAVLDGVKASRDYCAFLCDALGLPY